MGTNKHSGGGNCQGRECIREDDAVQEQELKRELPIIRVAKYKIDSDFKYYSLPNHEDHRYGATITRYSSDILESGKCYEYVYVDSMSADKKHAWATMKSNYAGKYQEPVHIVIWNYADATIRFNMEENGVEYINVVKPHTARPTFFREVPCKLIEIPSLKSLAYHSLRPQVREHLHNIFDLQPPTAGGNAVKRNKRSGRKTRRKSRRNTRRKSRRNKI